MTVYALRLENNKDTAPRVRMADALGLSPASSLLSTRQGIRPEPGAAETTVLPGTMQVRVRPFMGWVDGGVSVAQGGYTVVSDADVTLTIAAGAASQARIDVVAVVVKDDPFDGSGALSCSVVVVQGEPGNGEPALPANALALAQVLVPAGVSVGTGGLWSGLLTDQRTWLATGGTIPVSSQIERDALPDQPGQMVFRLDNNAIEVRGSTGWQSLGVSSAAPTYGANASAFSTEPSRVTRQGGLATLRYAVVSSASIPAGATLLTVPTGFRPPVAVRSLTQVISTGAINGVTLTPAGGLQANLSMAAGELLAGSLTYALS